MLRERQIVESIEIGRIRLGQLVKNLQRFVVPAALQLDLRDSTLIPRASGGIDIHELTKVPDRPRRLWINCRKLDEKFVCGHGSSIQRQGLLRALLRNTRIAAPKLPAGNAQPPVNGWVCRGRPRQREQDIL